MPVRWIPPEAERAIGLEYYETRTPGTGGRTKVDPEDFRVDEISLYPLPAPDGEFTILRVASRNWEQHELARRLAEELRLPPGAIAWAGTKDRRAVTEQLLSFRGGSPEPPPIAIPGVEIRDAYRSHRGLVLGHHFGNSFVIRVRDVPEGIDGAGSKVGGVTAELRALGRLPNLFGPQRFGEVRPVTHLVGRELVRGDPEAAVRTYLTFLTGAESTEGAEARSAFSEHRDPARALREFPAAYRFERSMLDHLARGQDPARALRAVPRELRLLFVHAYQSWIFNRYVALRRSQGLSMTRPEAGDRLLRITRDGTIPGVDPIPVSPDNLDEAGELVRRERGVLAGPLVGSGTPPIEGRPGAILESLLAEEGIERRQFDLPKLPEVASDGSWRPITVPVPPIAVRGFASEAGSSGYELSFALPKGSYATVLLREYQKIGARPSGAPD